MGAEEFFPTSSAGVSPPQHWEQEPLGGGSEDAENGISKDFALPRSAAVVAGVADVGFTWGNEI